MCNKKSGWRLFKCFSSLTSCGLGKMEFPRWKYFKFVLRSVFDAKDRVFVPFDWLEKHKRSLSQGVRDDLETYQGNKAIQEFIELNHRRWDLEGTKLEHDVWCRERVKCDKWSSSILLGRQEVQEAVVTKGFHQVTILWFLSI